MQGTCNSEDCNIRSGFFKNQRSCSRENLKRISTPTTQSAFLSPVPPTPSSPIRIFYERGHHFHWAKKHLRPFAKRSIFRVYLRYVPAFTRLMPPEPCQTCHHRTGSWLHRHAGTRLSPRARRPGRTPDRDYRYNPPKLIAVILS